MSQRLSSLRAGALALAALCGCSVIPAYPTSFPELTPAEARYGVAPDIRGRYRDRGLALSPDGEELGSASLRDLLRGGARPGTASPESPELVVEVGVVDGFLELHFLRNGEEVESLTRREVRVEQGEGADERSYVGNKGFAVLPVGTTSGGAGGVGAVVIEESLWCRRAVDGSLVVLQREFGAALLVLVPVWRTNTVWYRFPPADAPR
jgi:hypothetical protein